MALTPALAALGAKFAGMQMDAETDDSQLGGAGADPVLSFSRILSESLLLSLRLHCRATLQRWLAFSGACVTVAT